MGERTAHTFAPGDAGPPIRHQLTRTDLVMYAGASCDFHPMHTDEVAAITDYVGVGNLRSYKVRFTKQTWPGEVLTTSVIVRERRPGDELVLDCTVVNGAGEAKIRGEAVAAVT
jgi:acyl dehydratase